MGPPVSVGRLRITHQRRVHGVRLILRRRPPQGCNELLKRVAYPSTRVDYKGLDLGVDLDANLTGQTKVRPQREALHVERRRIAKLSHCPRVGLLSLQVCNKKLAGADRGRVLTPLNS
jgi:hypothetical protein